MAIPPHDTTNDTMGTGFSTGFRGTTTARSMKGISTTPTTPPKIKLTNTKINNGSGSLSVLNLSSRALDPYERELLGLGLTYVPTVSSQKFSSEQLKLDFLKLRDTYMTSYTKSASRAALNTLDRVTQTISQALLSIHCHASRDNLGPQLRKALGRLKEDNSIIISRADKGDQVVVMDTTHYTQLAWQHLRDPNVYERLDRDPTEEMTKNFNNYLEQTLKDGIINDEVAESLRLPSTIEIQTIYFVPKTHKTPLKVRPIVSSTNGPTSRASAYLDRILQPFMRQVPSYVRNSMDIISLLEKETFPATSLLATLDVESLYTNISHTRAINTFTRLLQAHPAFIFLLDLLRYVLFNNIFTFDGEIFRQTCGLAMGTKLAPALATLVLAEMEEEFLAHQNTKPLVWKRYIDDILLVWPTGRRELEQFLSDINNVDPHFKFTSTVSKTQTTFLDVTIFKAPSSYAKEGKLKTRIYYKTTNTFAYTRAESDWETKIFKAIVKGEGIRLLRNTGSKRMFYRLKQNLIKSFRKRGYSHRVLAPLRALQYAHRPRYLGKRLDRRKVPRPLPIVTKYFPFKENVTKIIKDLWKDIYDDPTLPYLLPSSPFVVFSHHPNLRMILSYKRRQFGSSPINLQPIQVFKMARFNRPRKPEDRRGRPKN